MASASPTAAANGVRSLVRLVQREKQRRGRTPGIQFSHLKSLDSELLSQLKETFPPTATFDGPTAFCYLGPLVHRCSVRWFQRCFDQWSVGSLVLWSFGPWDRGTVKPQLLRQVGGRFSRLLRIKWPGKPLDRRTIGIVTSSDVVAIGSTIRRMAASH
jgi:hypothetical protein